MTASLRPFWFSYGVTASVDPLSGMTVNLVLVDQWAKDFLLIAKAKIWNSFADFFQAAFIELEKKAALEKASVARLELVDDDDVPWIYHPKTQKMFWQQKVAMNIGAEAFWLQMKADAKTALNLINHFQHESYNDQSDLKRHLAPLAEASLISHRTGAELRLK